MSAVTKRDIALSTLDVLLADNKKVLLNFKQDLEKDTISAFMCGDDAVRSAVFCKHLCRSIESLRENTHAGLEPLIEFYSKKVFRLGSVTRRSTSGLRDMVMAAELEVTIQLLELFTDIQAYTIKNI